MTLSGRREFLKQAGAAAAAAFVIGKQGSRARAFAPSEVLNVGCIGTGGRCRRLMSRLVEVPGVRITAVCDIWDHHLAEGAKLADPKAQKFTDYRKLLESDDVDAVLIGSPDHWHVPMTVDACNAGKDAYVEKPLTHDLSEGQAVIDAQNRSKRIVQVGTQQRSMPQFKKAYEIIRSGDVGPIYKVRLTWNRNQARWGRGKPNIDPSSVRWKQFLGNAPDQPFDAYRFRNWRWFWDFGGGIFTDLMVHFIDVAYWYLGLDDPEMAASIGDHFKAKELWETPDTVQTLLRYPKQETQVYFEGTFVNARNAAMLEFMGSEGTLYLDRGRYEIIPERRSKLEPSALVFGKGPKGADFYDEVDGALYHLANWVDCVRSRKQPACPAEVGVQAAAAAHLANLSYRQGKIARWPGS